MRLLMLSVCFVTAGNLFTACRGKGPLLETCVSFPGNYGLECATTDNPPQHVHVDYIDSLGYTCLSPSEYGKLADWIEKHTRVKIR